MSTAAPPTPASSAAALKPALEPCALVIFGGAGDLSHRKLLPALYNLACDGELPSRLSIVAFDKVELDDERLRAFAREGIAKFSRRPLEEAHWNQFAPLLSFQSGSFAEARDFEHLRARLQEIDRARGTGGNRVYYLAIPPPLIDDCTAGLGAAGMVKAPGEAGFTRVVVEKPIGRDLQSAREINSCLARHFAESQIFRIDHYLGKETVQNLLALRFANAIFEPTWSARYVDHVQITVAEDEGIGTRGAYYERAGALRDIVQNHILQVLCMVAMEPPRSLEADAIRDAKLDVLRSLRPLERGEVARWVVRGQYAEGLVHGEKAPGYLEEKGVAPGSVTETFVALRCFVENWRWAGVPFYVRTGKRLPKRASEIAIQFNSVPRILFNVRPEHPLEANVLTVRIQPDEGLSLFIMSKVPGLQPRLNPIKVDFRYGAAYGGPSPEAYETLLLDVILGDQSLFMRRDMVEVAWQFVEPILEAWAGEPTAPAPYAAGTWGPPEADLMIAAEGGRRWRVL